MPKKAHTEEQIVAVLQQGQAGEKVADIFHKVNDKLADSRWFRIMTVVD